MQSQSFSKSAVPNTWHICDGPAPRNIARAGRFSKCGMPLSASPIVLLPNGADVCPACANPDADKVERLKKHFGGAAAFSAKATQNGT